SSIGPRDISPKAPLAEGSTPGEQVPRRQMRALLQTSSVKRWQSLGLRPRTRASNIARKPTRVTKARVQLVLFVVSSPRNSCRFWLDRSRAARSECHYGADNGKNQNARY